MVLIQGENGQGKSNLLEAMYILAISKSLRASADRELVRRQSPQGETYSQVSAIVQRDAEPLRVQVDFRSVPTPADEGDGPDLEGAQRTGPEGISVQKYVKVNGAPRRASDLVGLLNAVMFSAEDLELVHGTPTVRRRYLDILISQLDHNYLRALQRYQRVVYQRNQLLKRVREGSSRIDELDFWNDQLVTEGRYILSQRLCTVQALGELAAPIHRELTNDRERLKLLYRPSFAVGPDVSEEALAQDLREGLRTHQRREIAQGATLSGPHRDDLGLLINDMEAGVYASRGQSRTAALAMRLAEARYLTDQRQQEPVLLLDDVLSELDAARRAHVLEKSGQYQQCFITTTEVQSIGEEFLSQMSRFVVKGGRVEAWNSPARDN